MSHPSRVTDSAAVMLLADCAEAETRYRLKFARELSQETGRREYQRGLTEGYLLAVADIKAAQHGAVRDAELERQRWHLCCRRCRLEGHREGCLDCRNRTRATFGEPLPDEPGAPEIAAAARRSWEPLGLGPGPGWVHLGGQAVHQHQCTSACRDYEPGWYTLQDAIAIIATLPGEHGRVLAELRAQAGPVSQGKAAA